MIPFVIGIALLQWLPVLPALLWPCIATAILFSCCFIGNNILRKISILLFALCLGFTWAAFQAKRTLSKKLPETDFGKVISAEGWVASIPKKTRLGLQFQFRLKHANGKPENGLVQVSWYQQYEDIQVGDEWRFSLKLKHIHGLMNPDGFDYQRWAFMHGIVAKGYIIDRVKPHLIQRHSWKYPITHYRARLQHLIQNTIKEPSYSAIITALSIGAKSLITPDLWRVFQRTGTSHLIAISGLHVGMVAAAIYFLLAWLWRCFPRFLLYIPAQRVGALASIIVACTYGLLVGFSLPTQRAVIMIAVLMLSQLLSRYLLLWRRLLLAFVIVVALQPLALFSASFWLSFSAVFWIAYAMVEDSWWRLQLAVFVGLMPLTLFYFHQISLVSIVANIIAIPWVTLLLVPICLLACIVNFFSLSAAGFLFFLAEKMLMPLWWFLQWLSHFSFSVWVHPLHQFFVLFSLFIAIALLLAPRGFPSRYLALVFLIPFFFTKIPRPKQGDVWISLLDVGQGLSAVVQTAQHVLVYDAGPKYPTGFDAGRSVVMPYLQDIGVSKIDTLMISHGDNDHIGGAKWLLSMMPIKQLITSVPKSHWQRPVTTCYSGESWQWDQVNFQVLSPRKNTPYEDNNSSCVLHIRAGAHSILLTGDIEKSVEKILLLEQKRYLPSSVLVAPHHGSRSSSSLAFVETVHPQYVLLPVGYENRYRFPAASVLQRYQSVGAQIFTTAKQGAIQLHLPKEGVISARTVYHRRHYWQN